MYKPKENIWDVESSNNYEEVTNYIKKKTEKLEKIKQDLLNIKDLFKDYISITKKYCDQIAVLALQLKPEANTNEGNLTQAIQGILLFNSVSLETLANEMEKIFKSSKKKEKNDSGINILDEFSKIYQSTYSNLLNNYGIYITEIEKYEKYLMNEEMGFNNEEKIIHKANSQNIQNKASGEIKSNSSNNINKVEKINCTKLTNNIEKVLEAKKNYIKEIEPMNNIINKLVEYGLNEEKLLNEEFSNILKMFLDKLNECLEGQKKKYEGQSSVLADLYAKIKSEKIENLKSGIQEYRLHCLSVYINIKNIARNKGNNSQEIVLNQKSKDFEIYKNITLENIENIIKEMKKNGLEIRAKDLEDLEKEKVKDFIERKSKLVSEKTDENFSKEDKDKLIEYFKEDEEYRSLFLQILNNDRAKGGEIFNKNIFLYMGEIFENINDLVLEKNDYRFFKYVSIISMTYFITEKNKKRYLFEFIKDNNKLKFMDFWKKYSTFVVELDMENDITKKELITEQSTKTKYKFAAFSNTLTIVNNMVNFGFDKNFIKEFINFAENNYSLSKEQIGQIEDLMVVWSSNTDTSNYKNDENNNDNNNKETNKDEMDSNNKDKYEDMK